MAPSRRGVPVATPRGWTEGTLEEKLPLEEDQPWEGNRQLEPEEEVNGRAWFDPSSLFF